MFAAHQPNYLPWLGFFDKLDRADTFVLLDTVQYRKNDWINRNRIKTVQGWQWLTVPVSYRFPQRIHEVGISPGVWSKKHLQALRSNYGKSRSFNEYFPFFQRVFAQRWERLVKLNVFIIKELAGTLGIKTKIRIASGLKTVRDDPNDRLIDLCRQMGADEYLAGAGGKEYMDLKKFKQAGVRVYFQDYCPPVYSQLFGGFEANLSVVDLLFNQGDESLAIIRGGNR
ncbi:WbqC family protein [candidate division KSB1 bacterium]|nr:WbqC family protein [candidate division KSB1 bacterium]